MGVGWTGRGRCVAGLRPNGWPKRRPHGLALLVLSASLMMAAPVRAQTPLACEIGSVDVVCTLNAVAQFDEDLRDLLENGFTNYLVYRVYLFRTGAEEPVAVTLVSFAEVFRLYTDVYYISREGTEGYVAGQSWEEAVRELARFEVRLGSVEELGPGEFFSGAILEVNPLRQEQLLEARRWIARSRGGYRLFGEGEQSFFGTFVSLFVNVDLTSAEARRTFRSEPFEVPP